MPSGDGSFWLERLQWIGSLPSLPRDHLALLDGPVTVTLTSHNPNGSSHHSPVWLGRDDTHLYLSSFRGQLNDRNLRARPDATLLLVDPANPYRRMTVAGVVEQVVDEDDHAGSPVVTSLLDQLWPSTPNGARKPVHTDLRGSTASDPSGLCCMGAIGLVSTRRDCLLATSPRVPGQRSSSTWKASVHSWDDSLIPICLKQLIKGVLCRYLLVET